jgi:MscS family membrane protein
LYWIIGVLMVIGLPLIIYWHLLTGLSIVGAAIALSLRESWRFNCFRFVIFLDKPFTTGDLVSG